MTGMSGGGGGFGADEEEEEDERDEWTRLELGTGKPGRGEAPEDNFISLEWDDCFLILNEIYLYCYESEDCFQVRHRLGVIDWSSTPTDSLPSWMMIHGEV